jgi:ADP-heptose:LPS heptosyltransferase
MLNINKVFTLPFKCNIPNNSRAFIKKKPLILIWLKYIKRYIFIHLNGQKHLEIQKIEPIHKRILWINISAPSLGDSLMDLSSRTMLNDKKIDLFTDRKNDILYENDSIYQNVYSDVKLIKENNYDLVIIDSFSSRSIRTKVAIANFLPYVTIYGYYNGPEVNRVLFSFHQMNNLLSYPKKEYQINRMAKSTISISNFDELLVQKLNLPSDYIAIVLGGEWRYRTYIYWHKVIEGLLDDDQELNIVLLGSSNAQLFADRINVQFSEFNLFDCVNKFTFKQTTQIIKNAKILLCCDGGLMHAANSVNTPIVALLAKLTPDMQLTQAIAAFTLYDKEDVNNLSFDEVKDKYKVASNFVHNHLLF